MKQILGMLIVGLLIIPISLGAEIYGSVYGPSLNKVPNLVIEIDSSPVQRLVSHTGDYSFNVNPGKNYTISAKIQNKVVAQESVFLSEEGRFILDLFVLPDFSEEDQIFFEVDEPELEDSLFSSGGSVWTIGAIIGGMLVLGMIYFRKSLFRKKNEIIQGETAPAKTDLDGIIEMIKKEGGRITQKDLRKHFPLSEAKVSLMIAELEAKGKIEKIKKGRGNILILK